MNKPNKEQANNTIMLAAYMSENCGFCRSMAINKLMEFAGVNGYDGINDLRGVTIHFKNKDFINDTILHDLESIYQDDIILRSKGYWELINRGGGHG